VTIHDVAWKYYPEYFPLSKRLAFDFLTNYAVKHANKIVAVSESTKKDLIKYYNCDPKKIYVIGEGFDSKKYHPVFTQSDANLIKLHGLNYRQYLLYIGTLQKRKNIINMIKAYDKSKCKLPLVLAGNPGWFYEEIDNAIRSSPKKDLIIRLGYISEDEKAALYRGCRMFLYPSLYEGFGLPVLEAMACGCLVLTSNVSSMPEIIGNTGFVVDPLDVEAMVDAINAGTDYAYQELRNSAISRSLLFTWERAAEITLSTLSKIEL
jgi:glycosyltransferase involved in cell wall biosynthesis